MKNNVELTPTYFKFNGEILPCLDVITCYLGGKNTGDAERGTIRAVGHEVDLIP